MKKIIFVLSCLLMATSLNAQDTLNLKCYIQGYYNASGDTMTSATTNMNCIYAAPQLASIIYVELHSTSYPYDIVTDGFTEADLHTDGHATCIFPYISPDNDTYYYVVVKAFNTLATWSSDTINFPTSTGQASWDFTTASSQAVAGEQAFLEYGVWGLESGDVDQDGCIDPADAELLDDSINNFDYGCDHILTDLNGDGNVDLVDVPFLDGNLYNCSGVPEP